MARVGAVELIQRLPPAHDTLALDEAGGLVGTLAGPGAAGLAFAGALVLDVDDGQPQQLDHGVVVREVTAGLGDLAELVVQRLDRMVVAPGTAMAAGTPSAGSLGSAVSRSAGAVRGAAVYSVQPTPARVTGSGASPVRLKFSFFPGGWPRSLRLGSRRLRRRRTGSWRPARSGRPRLVPLFLE